MKLRIKQVGNYIKSVKDEPEYVNKYYIQKKWLLWYVTIGYKWHSEYEYQSYETYDKARICANRIMREYYLDKKINTLNKKNRVRYYDVEVVE